MSERYVLPTDVALIPATALEEALRARLAPAAGAYAIDRPLLRSNPKLVDGDTAALLREFRAPRTLAAAIVQVAARRGVDPIAIVPNAYAALAQFISSGILVEEGSPLAAAIRPRLSAGEAFGPWRIRECVRLMSDVELYLAHGPEGTPVALKLYRDSSDQARRASRHEAAILKELDGNAAPAVLTDGSSGDPPFVIMEWCRGVDADTAADDERDVPPSERRALRWRRATAIALAYAELHDRGVLHGDVHEGNLLIDRDGTVRLIDFGLARSPSYESDALPGRGGVLEYFEPEFAIAEVSETASPETSALGEQYSIAAMIFRMVAGAHYLDFAPGRTDIMHQIATQAPRSFNSCGVLPWPSLEAVLARALRKRPDERFPTVRAFAAALETATPENDAPSHPRRETARTRRHARGIAEIWTALSPGDPRFARGFSTAPRCSLALGAAGAAFAWYRRSLVTGSADHLAAARHWITLAMTHSKAKDAFFDGDELTPASIGTASIHHGSPGVALTAALIAHALADEWNALLAVRGWAREIRTKRITSDLTIGRAGAIASAAMLREALDPTGWRGMAIVARRGTQAMDSLWKELDAIGPIGDDCVLANLGVAHGWAGMLHASLRWTEVAGCAEDRNGMVRRRLGELAQCAEPSGRGLRWPWRDAPVAQNSLQSYAAGWCNGSAGFVHLWLEAHAMYHDASWRELAEGAAWYAWENGDEEVETLCCGLAGRAYAMLAMLRATGDPTWWRRARDLAARAVAATRFDHDEALSLYRGALGVALLLEELEHPHVARMPAFEADGFAVPR